MSDVSSTIQCTLTSIGLEKSQEAANNTGFYIQPTTFGVSNVAGIFSSSRTSANPMWFQGGISVVEKIDSNTLAFHCDLTEDAYNADAVIKEIYLFALDKDNKEFLLCLGQTSGITYVTGNRISIKLIVNIANFDILSSFKYTNSAAKDIDQHNNDLNAHSYLVSLIKGTKGNILNISSNYTANISDNIFCNTKNNEVEIILPKDNLNGGDKITIYDSSGYADINNITIKSYYPIDFCSNSFKINVSGGKVVFIFDSSLQTWVVDLGGRLNTISFVDKNKTNLLFSSYFTRGIPVYSIYNDYVAGDVVSYNGSIFICLTPNGSGDILQPQISLAWKQITFDISRVTLNGSIADSAVICPKYKKGSGMLKVFIDGILCNFDTYYEDPAVNDGYYSTFIYFRDTIPNTFSIELII